MADSYKLSKEGKLLVDNSRRERRWNTNSPEWIEMAHTSESTLKRFLRGNKISSDHFISICEAIGLTEWQKLVDWEDKDSTRVGSFSTQTPTVQKTERKTRGRVVVSGTFDEGIREEIDIVVEHLKTLLTTCNVTISPSDNDKID
ncbi:hypothetical protein [Myxosarcina sp. GI1]|uniref:hypothetical protein n=1 Tax=Myxosarcina sp. GI1 TaxID=1541065 RepID=UPI00056D4D7F|nr:hypothetical protein [Myxosarcina sp. GI1]